MIEKLKNSVTNISFLLGLVISLIGLFFKKLDFSIGIMLGTLTSILTFRLLAKNVEGILKSKTSMVAFKSMGGYFFRLIIMAAVLWFAINKSLVCFIGAAIGLFATRIAIYINSYLEKKNAKVG
ncbi:MAG: ATP synthase subunit I [Candidatus Omnitrophica bacterium]|nr:ATP synthase subunit I [Candidatus Omnitrophota bacterium]